MAFDTNNQPAMEDRKPRGKGKKTMMLDAIRAQVDGGESEFLKKVVEHALGDGKEIKPNPQLMTLVLQRIEPPMKSTMPLIEFDFDENASPSQQASQVIKASADGVIPPDVASVFMTSISSMMKIEEVTTIKADIERIKEQLGISDV